LVEAAFVVTARLLLVGVAPLEVAIAVWPWAVKWYFPAPE
jgi:hypothetical protein